LSGLVYVPSVNFLFYLLRPPLWSPPVWGPTIRFCPFHFQRVFFLILFCGRLPFRVHLWGLPLPPQKQVFFFFSFFHYFRLFQKLASVFGRYTQPWDNLFSLLPQSALSGKSLYLFSMVGRYFSPPPSYFPLLVRSPPPFYTALYLLLLKQVTPHPFGLSILVP